MARFFWLLSFRYSQALTGSALLTLVAGAGLIQTRGVPIVSRKTAGCTRMVLFMRAAPSSCRL